MFMSATVGVKPAPSCSSVKGLLEYQAWSSGSSEAVISDRSLLTPAHPSPCLLSIMAPSNPFLDQSCPVHGT